MSKLTFMMLWPMVVVVTLIAGSVGRQWFDLLRKYRRSLVSPTPQQRALRRLGLYDPREDETASASGGGFTLAEARAELPKHTHRGVLIALPAVSIITFLAFPTVSSIAFRAWACVEFDTDTQYDADNSPLPRAPPNVQGFMRDDLRIQCGSRGSNPNPSPSPNPNPNPSPNPNPNPNNQVRQP